MNAELNAPTPERKRRSAFAVTPAVATDSGPAQAGQRVYRALSTLDRLLRSGAIQPPQHEAGERLRTDYELGIAGAREAASGSAGTTGWYYADAHLAALRRYQDAIAALGPTKTYVLLIVLGQPGCGDLSVSEVAQAFGRNRQEVAGILKLGLSELADHYGIDCDRTKISHNLLTSRNRRYKHSANRP